MLRLASSNAAANDLRHGVGARESSPAPRTALSCAWSCMHPSSVPPGLVRPSSSGWSPRIGATTSRPRMALSRVGLDRVHPSRLPVAMASHRATGDPDHPGAGRACGTCRMPPPMWRCSNAPRPGAGCLCRAGRRRLPHWTSRHQGRAVPGRVAERRAASPPVAGGQDSPWQVDAHAAAGAARDAVESTRAVLLVDPHRDLAAALLGMVPASEPATSCSSTSPTVRTRSA